MPSPIPTYERILTLLHRDRDDCDGPVGAIRRRGWKWWKYDFFCTKCGEDLTPQMDCPFTGKDCRPSCRLFDGGNCLYEDATRAVLEGDKLAKEMMGSCPSFTPRLPPGMKSQTFTAENMPPEVANMLRNLLQRLQDADDDDDFEP